MNDVRLSATPKSNGYQATVTFPHGASISSAEAFPSIPEAVAAAARKLLDMPERIEALGDDVDNPPLDAAFFARMKPSQRGRPKLGAPSGGENPP